MADEKEETFSPTSIDDLVNRSGRPRDENGRFIAQPRDEGDQPGTETLHVETQQAASDATDAGEAHADGDGAQASGEAVQQPAKTTSEPGKPVPQTAPVAAVIAARDKGKAATDELVQAKARIAELEAAAKAPPASIATSIANGGQPQLQRQPAPQGQRPARASVFDDENAFADDVVSVATQRARMEALNDRLSLAEEIVRDKNPDFDEVMGMEMVTVQTPDGPEQQPRFKAWLELKETRPDLERAFHKAANPVRFAYEAVKKDRDARLLTDPKHIDALVEAKVNERLAAQANGGAAVAASPAKVQSSPSQSGPTPNAKPAPAAPPPSIANKTSTNLSRGAPGFQGPTSLDAILNQVGKPHATTN